MRAIPPGEPTAWTPDSSNQRCVKVNKECPRSADTGQDESLPAQGRQTSEKEGGGDHRRLLDA